MAKIKFRVAKTGEVEHTVEGISGAGCRKASAPWESLFGNVISSTNTAEAFEEPEMVEVKGKQQ